MAETVYTSMQQPLGVLVQQIDDGSIGLPDIQRPFVWETAKVRDLFDSMYRGYPVGHLLFWESGAEPGTRQIGTNAKQLVPSQLIVDGQQRLTSLFAVMKRRPIVGTDYREHKLQLAFRPRDQVFSVPNAATAKDPSYLNDISDIWERPAFTVIQEFLTRLDGDSEEEKLDQAESLNRLASLPTYMFSIFRLGANIGEDQVAEVFVRINSQGKNLNQADFILTLMSVYWDEGRFQLEDWCRGARVPGDAAWSSYPSPEPGDLLRVAIALGFRRGRLEDAYTVLRGRDPKTQKISPEARAKQFGILAEAQSKVVDKATWKEFLQCLLRAGHRSKATISSENAVFYAYAFYLIGRHDYKVPPKLLRDVIARWFFMASLTGRYSSSPETVVAADLASLPESTDAQAFVDRLEEMISHRLTNDYWQIGLPGELATSASRGATLFGYLSSLCVLSAQVLFSKMRCAELLDPALSGGEAKVHRHHLFPRHFLEGQGISDTRQVNQIANQTLLEWHDNLDISASDPSVYWPAYLKAMREPPPGSEPFSEQEVTRMLELHALPTDWPDMEYDSFLTERRRLMAGVVRQAFERLSKGQVDEPESVVWPPSQATIEHLLQVGETERVELKSSLRADMAGKGIPAKVLEHVVARTIAGFLNQEGGLLIIGADDAGTPLGLEADFAALPKKNLDGFQLALMQVIDRHLGGNIAGHVRVCLAKVGPDHRDVAIVDCPAHDRPVFLDSGQAKEFHVRAGTSTRLLDIEEATTYIANHWKGQA